MDMQLLSDICSFGSGRVSVQELTLKNYISTENLQPNKGGLVDAAGLPNVNQVQAVDIDDVLVSNIRPYFKKIWHAKETGGCSNDVLVFRANSGVDPKFLYYVLADDNFFEYATATAKGTKMPRGDKKAIMQYSVPKLSLNNQKKIGDFLRNLDDKIATNNAINKNLEEQAQALFKAWFVD
ncbi:MAG: restriction endonuclease subunit S, partial [Phascolarctobacterium sp.]|nr:restriction endonuclease subunit S [Phascolarctobacterium sp.]